MEKEPDRDPRALRDVFAVVQPPIDPMAQLKLIIDQLLPDPRIQSDAWLRKTLRDVLEHLSMKAPPTPASGGSPPPKEPDLPREQSDLRRELVELKSVLDGTAKDGSSPKSFNLKTVKATTGLVIQLLYEARLRKQ